MRKKQVTKLVSILLVGIIFVFSFSHFGASTYDRVFSKSNVFEVGTTIGSVDVSGLTKEEAVESITSHFDTWFQSSSLSIHYKEVEKKIETEMFRFSIKQSVNLAENGKTSPLVIHIQEPVYMENIKSFNDESVLNYIDHSTLQREILNVVTTMKTGDFDFNLLDFVNKELQFEVISESSLSISDEQYKLLSEELVNKNRLTLPAMSQFSFVDFIQEQSITLSSESLNILSSALYKVILLSNMEVIERNTSRQLPEYIEMGFEAQVSMENLDFVLFNPNTTEYIVNIILHDNKVTMELVGAPLLYRYEIALEDKTTYPPKSIIQFDPTLPLGTSKILEVGKKGSLIKVLRNKMEENGEIVSTELISEDFYPPVHQVVLSSILSRENTEAEATEPEDDIEDDDETNDETNGETDTTNLSDSDE